jgi:hypothetical protein
MNIATMSWREASDLQTCIKEELEAAMGIGDPLLRPALTLNPANAVLPSPCITQSMMSSRCNYYRHW